MKNNTLERGQGRDHKDSKDVEEALVVIGTRYIVIHVEMNNTSHLSIHKQKAHMKVN
jgi:hypothetical protein